MATASVEPSDTECSVCHENFSTPKILPCAHLLCRCCLINWLKSETDARCPLCRDVIADTKEKAGKSYDDIADSLPTDLVMAARVECAAILSKKHVCCCCRHTAAGSICLDCGDTLCITCSTFHGNMSATRHHKVEDLATMTAERLAANRRLPCSVHANKTSELYCPTHGAAICQLCATSKHRACPEVTELEEKMQESRSVLAELAATLKAGESKLEGAISELDQYLVDMEKATQAAQTDIDHKCDRLQSSVEACRKRMKELAKGANSEVRQKVEEGKSVLLKRFGRVASHWRLVDRTRDKMPPVCGVGYVTSTLQSRVKGLDLSVMSAALKAVTMTTLTIDEESVACIEASLSDLGRLEETPVFLLQGRCPTWRFHTRHGGNIVLSNDERTATRVKGKTHGIVLSDEAMTTNTLYEIRVDSTEGDTTGCSLRCGVTLGDPDTVISSMRDLQSSNGLDESLMGLPVGSRVGLSINTANSLHLFVDGQDKGVAAFGVGRPCRAFFLVHHAYKKISTLPLSHAQ